MSQFIENNEAIEVLTIPSNPAELLTNGWLSNPVFQALCEKAYKGKASDYHVSKLVTLGVYKGEMYIKFKTCSQYFKGGDSFVIVGDRIIPLARLRTDFQQPQQSNLANPDY